VADVKSEGVRMHLKPKRDFKVLNVANKELLDYATDIECSLEGNPDL
jgi:hypothetical protein